ncbi:MAG: NADH-quinone oxidoreductase subunit NuoG [Armatimonadetes bacterium]|nr:NADH-quinone oxidoreductase subunit NuoG [Armatimonadota bacterium]
MAAATEIQTVNIIVNGIELAVPKGELVVEAVKRIGVDIPIFCYHPRLKPVGMCRMCLVMTGAKQPDGTIRMFPKPAAACTMPVSEGLVVDTESDAVKNDRKGVLEFLLVNHPLDCPICDRGGECPLQNNTLFYGPSTSRFIEMKRHAPKAFPLSEYVTLDLERCIQCARCVRFTEEISGDAQLAFRFRGADTQPITFNETKFTSKFSGNVIEICPVGALTSRKYRFRARPWDLESSEAICTQCSAGCAVWFDHRGGKFARINGRTNEAINEEWTCDRGKFGHAHYNGDKRLDSVFVRSGDELAKSNWREASPEILAQFVGKGSEAGLILGHGVSNEGAWNAVKFFREHVGSNNIDHRFERFLPESYSTPKVSSSIASFEGAGTIVVFGTSLADDLPMLYLRVRKAWFQKGAKVIVAADRETEVDSFAHLVLRYKPGTAGLLAEALRTGEKLAAVAEKSGVWLADLQEAVELVKGAPVVTSTGIYNDKTGAEAVQSLDALASATGGSFNCYARGANERGLQLMGAVPQGDGLATQEMLAAAANGRLSALWLVGVDLFSVGLDRNLVERALENVDYLVVQDALRTETFYYASAAVPMTLQAEADGSYTNMEGKVQELKAVIPAVGEAKPVWRTFEELSLRIAPRVPLMQAEDVRATIPALA